MKKHASHNLTELKRQIDPESGWTGLVSIGTTTEGWIHNLIDKLYQQQKLLAKVYFIWHFAVNDQRQAN
jgi:hypothetical protein